MLAKPDSTLNTLSGLFTNFLHLTSRILEWANGTMVLEYNKLFLALGLERTQLFHKYQIKMDQTAKTIQHQKASGRGPRHQPTQDSTLEPCPNTCNAYLCILPSTSPWGHQTVLTNVTYHLTHIQSSKNFVLSLPHLSADGAHILAHPELIYHFSFFCTKLINCSQVHLNHSTESKSLGCSISQPPSKFYGLCQQSLKQYFNPFQSNPTFS